MQRAGALAAAVRGESGAGYCFITGVVAEGGEHIAVVHARCGDRCVPCRGEKSLHRAYAARR